MSWMIRVTFANGRETWLRRGARAGAGPIITFRTRAKAEAEAAFMREGLDSDDVITLVEQQTFPTRRAKDLT